MGNLQLSFLEVFGWFLTGSSFIFDILPSLMVGHPFGGAK